ncbi:MAG TPA: glycosyltransferase [Mucilaginibacter sp.]
MKILFITPSYKPAYIYGGPTVVISLLAESLVKSGHDVTVFTTTANGSEELDVKTNTEILLDGVKVYYFKRYTKDHSHISPGLWQKTYRDARKFDIVHLHTWWSTVVIISTLICKLLKVKTILSPHGMFCDYIINTRNRRLKRLFLRFGKPLLRNTFLHVSSQMEWEETRHILNGICDGKIILNMVRLGDSKKTISKDHQPTMVVGFISRIEPKKGLELLIEALSKVNFDYRLKIAGTGEQNYIDSLKALSVGLGNSDKLDWLGWKDNQEKFEFYSDIDLLALTSYNENFAVVVVESLSVGTPVLISENVGLSDYVLKNKLGFVTGIDDTSLIALKLDEVYQQKLERDEISQIAPQIIRSDFDETKLLKQYCEVYTTLAKSPVSSQS